MEIRNINRVIAFELEVQLRSRAFWLLSLIPPIAVILIMTVNLHVRPKSRIAVHNMSRINTTLEGRGNVEFEYVDSNVLSDSLCPQLGNYDAMVSICDGEESGLSCVFHEVRPIPEDIRTAIILGLKKEMIKRSLGDDYSRAEEYADTHLEVNYIQYQRGSVLYGLSTLCVFLIYFVVLQFASSILGAMGREKKNKISEILLTAMSGGDIMIGKLVSGFVAAVLQVLLWLCLAICLLAVIGNVSDDYISLATIWDILGSIKALQTETLLPFCAVFVTSFVGGYFLYSTLFSFVGVISNENTNTRQFSLILTLPLLLTFVYVTKNPNSNDSIMRFLSYFPLSSPIALLPGFVNGMPVSSVIISVFIIFVTIAVVIVYSSKLYAYGISATKTKVTLWTIVSWIKRGHAE